MAITKAPLTLLASQSLAANNTTVAAPTLPGATYNATSGYGGLVTWSLINGSSPPTTPPFITIQVSSDGATWRNYYTVGGDTTASSINSGVIEIARSVMYVRAVAYGNQTNPVTVAVELVAVTGL